MMVSKTVAFAAKDWDHAPVALEKISDLILDWRLYPRMEVDHKVVVERYARAMQAGANFPYIKVGILAGKKIIVDGAHRVGAYMLLKIDHVTCAELPFSSEAELFAEAVRLNSSHGKNFTEAELKANIRRLQKYKFDVKDIVALVHVPACEIHREAAAPVTVLTSPSGKKILCRSPDFDVDEPDVKALVELKNALMLVCRWAESGQVPNNHPAIRKLVERTRLALGKVRFNA
jgi:hypothetical protein